MHTEAAPTHESDIHAVHARELKEPGEATASSNLPYAMIPDYASPEEVARHDGYGWCEGNVSYSASGKLRAITDDDGIVLRWGPDLLWMLNVSP